MWYTKLFMPVAEKHETNNIVPSNDNTNEIFGSPQLVDKTVQDFHTLQYEWMSDNLEELIWINNTLESGNSGQINAIIKKYYGYTFNLTKNQITSYGTTTRIKNTTVKLGITSGILVNMFCGGQYTSGGGITATLGYSKSTPIPGVSIGFSYVPITTTSIYPVRIGYPSGSCTVADGKYLQSDGNYMNVVVSYANGSGTCCGRFQYTLSGPNSTQYGDVSVENTYN